MKLKVDPAVPGGLLHPPGSFAIGPHRGFLHYPGQPLYCRRCGAFGHMKEACVGRRCRLCGADDHIAVECGAPKACSLCGSEEHLYRLCPSRRATYASLFSEEFSEISETLNEQEKEDRSHSAAVTATKVMPKESNLSQEEEVKEVEGHQHLQAEINILTQVPETLETQLAGGHLSGKESAPLTEVNRGADEVGPSASTWTHTSWAEDLEQLEAIVTTAQPDWALMDIANRLQTEEMDQELGDPTARSTGQQVRAADTPAEEKGPKRACIGQGRTFDSLTMEKGDFVADEINASKRSPSLGPGEPGEEKDPQDVSMGDEEGWSQILSRKVRPPVGRGRGIKKWENVDT